MHTFHFWNILQFVFSPRFSFATCELRTAIFDSNQLQTKHFWHLTRYLENERYTSDESFRKSLTTQKLRSYQAGAPGKCARSGLYLFFFFFRSCSKWRRLQLLLSSTPYGQRETRSTTQKQQRVPESKNFDEKHEHFALADILYLNLTTRYDQKHLNFTFYDTMGHGRGDHRFLLVFSLSNFWCVEFCS